MTADGCGFLDPILDSMPCGFLSSADDGSILLCNRTLVDILGLTGEILRGRKVETILTVASRIFWQTHFFPLLKMAGHTDEIYLTLKTASNGEIPVLINATRTEREGVTVNDCVLMPMARRNMYEDEVLRAKKNLVDTNADLERARTAFQESNSELSAFNERLEDLIKLRTADLQAALEDLSSLSYAVAHDLRAPLRSIVSTSEILREEAPDCLSAEHMALLARQSFNGQKLGGLIDGLLKFARMERHGIERTETDLSQMAQAVVADIEPFADQMRPEIVIEPDLHAMCDPEAVRLVLMNLIENAVKYSPRGGTVRVGRSETGFFVSDEGIGFDMNYFEKIFLPFERLHGDVDYQGSGIGLAIVKRIVERHGGKVWAESRVGVGSTFFFTLE